MVKIAPSILSADFSRLGEEVKQVEAAGADLIHVDVMDGHFVPNITIGPVVVSFLRKAVKIPLDVHLMIENPDKYIKAFARAGANLLSVHAETERHLHRVIGMIKEEGCSAGVVLNPATSLDALACILDDLDFVLLMSVNPGFGGQKFIWGVLNKVRQLKEEIIRRGLDVKIEIDGGIGLENLSTVVESGVDMVVAGSAIFCTEDPGATVKEFQKICSEA